MFEAKIISGCWDEGKIELSGMPKTFVLSARNLAILELDEYNELVSSLDVSERLVAQGGSGHDAIVEKAVELKSLNDELVEVILGVKDGLIRHSPSGFKRTIALIDETLAKAKGE